MYSRDAFASTPESKTAPFLEGRLLAETNNRAMKELVEKMAPKLSASSIRDYVNIVKSVVASAINEDGEEIFSA